MNEVSEIWIVIIQVNGDYDSGNVYSRQTVGSLFNDAYNNRNNFITYIVLANVIRISCLAKKLHILCCLYCFFLGEEKNLNSVLILFALTFYAKWKYKLQDLFFSCEHGIPSPTSHICSVSRSPTPSPPACKAKFFSLFLTFSPCQADSKE